MTWIKKMWNYITGKSVEQKYLDQTQEDLEGKARETPEDSFVSLDNDRKKRMWNNIQAKINEDVVRDTNIPSNDDYNFVDNGEQPNTDFINQNNTLKQLKGTYEYTRLDKVEELLNKVGVETVTQLVAPIRPSKLIRKHLLEKGKESTSYRQLSKEIGLSRTLLTDVIKNDKPVFRATGSKLDKYFNVPDGTFYNCQLEYDSFLSNKGEQNRE